MSDSPSSQKVEELVDFLVGKKISKQMLKKIVSQVDEVEYQELIEQRSSRILLAALVLLAAIIVLLLALDLKP